MTYSKRRMVLVEWRDAMHEHHGWLSNYPVTHTSDVVESIGWLIRKDKLSMTIAQSDGMDNLANTLQIPIQMVRHVRYLRTANDND